MEYQEISDFFQDMELNAEQFEKILDFLETSNIDVLRITDNDDDTVDDEILLDDEEEVEVEKLTYPFRTVYRLKTRFVCI